MQALATMSSEQTLRSILDKLIFDPDNIYMNKNHLIPYCEEKIVDMYMRIVSRTGTLNFDELVAEVILHNNEIIQMAASFLFDYPDSRGCVGRESYDLFRCDITRWMRDIERKEVSAFAPISSFVIKVLTKYDLAFVPYMEERYEDHSREAFGVHGIVVANDCQNVLFPSFMNTPNIDRLDLGTLDRVSLIRSPFDASHALKGYCNDSNKIPSNGVL